MTARRMDAGSLAPWQRDRLAEARAILADAAHHHDSLNLLACNAVCSLSPDEAERSEMQGLMRFLKGPTP